MIVYKIGELNGMTDGNILPKEYCIEELNIYNSINDEICFFNIFLFFIFLIIKGIYLY